MNLSKSFTNLLSPLALLTLSVVVTSGCNDGLASVSGNVVLDGTEVKQTDTIRCEVTLKPLGEGPAATGSVDQKGQFLLSVGASRSLAPGEYRAAIRVREITPSPNPGGYTQSRSLAADRYASLVSSDLSYTIQPGSNHIELAIASQ